MLRIREQQIQALQNLMIKRFEDTMVDHLKANYPDEYGHFGEEGVREEIRCGIARAQSYAIDVENDVSRYINLMFVFGRGFDEDPDLPWASRILKNEQLKGTHKMDLLYEQAARCINNPD